MQSSSKQGMYWLIFFVLFFCGIFKTIAGHAQERSVYTKGCTVWFPENYQHVIQSVTVGKEDVQYELFVTEKEDKSFFLLVAQYPLPIGEASQREYLEGFVKGLLGEKNTLLESKECTVNKKKALSFVLSGGGKFFSGKVALWHQKVYLLAVASSTKNSKMQEKFLSSLSFVDN